MRSAGRCAGVIAAAVALTVGATGCTASDPSVTDGTTSAPSSKQQILDAACETVKDEWGFALDSWVALETDTRGKDFAQKRTEHLAVVSTLQDIADRVEAPELRRALDASIGAHQQYADTIWQGLDDVPEGYVVDVEDPANLLVVLGKRKTELEQRMSDADVQRYDLCGVLQSGQTAAQACEIADGDWVDGGEVYNRATDVASRGDVTEAQRQAADGLEQLKAALAKVSDPEAHTEMASMYEAYETFYEDGFSNLLTQDQLLQLSDAELDAYTTEAEAAFTVWDDTLSAGEKRLSAYCAAEG